uniref:Uncharacterized protein n=1 Tax=Rhizophora mucronata TaxID=61149 RepID=A0A2P2Q3W0_RHIMU
MTWMDRLNSTAWFCSPSLLLKSPTSIAMILYYTWLTGFPSQS